MCQPRGAIRQLAGSCISHVSAMGQPEGIITTIAAATITITLLVLLRLSLVVEVLLASLASAKAVLGCRWSGNRNRSS